LVGLGGELLKTNMPKRRQPEPIHTAISTWLDSVTLDRTDDGDASAADRLLALAPKRFIIYEPMAQLPAGSFTQPQWIAVLDQQSEDARARLWSLILGELSKKAGSTLTHLAVTAGIPLHQDGAAETENVMRSPSGLRMLHGDFGPTTELQKVPTAEDFERTLWVSTKQNGIHQTWAPKWTMFSRGNVKEKARLLGFPPVPPPSAAAAATDGGTGEQWAVDLYAGIGYFVFSYASLGMKVLCWEINPWSVEGLRRGARANRWSVRVVQGDDLSLPTEDIMAGEEQIVVFLEDNQRALSRIRSLHALGVAHDIRHVNCGFLPTSEPTWEMAWDMTSRSDESWLHLHENVGVNDITSRREAIQERYSQRASGKDGGSRTSEAEHVELVKTFAPGVWHCVFDVHVRKIQ
jgi:tRNA wybutosine-synthesizing protein 2